METVFYYFVFLFSIFCVLVVKNRALYATTKNLYNENNRYLRWIFKNKKEILD